MDVLERSRGRCLIALGLREKIKGTSGKGPKLTSQEPISAMKALT